MPAAGKRFELIEQLNGRLQDVTVCNTDVETSTIVINRAFNINGEFGRDLIGCEKGLWER